MRFSRIRAWRPTKAQLFIAGLLAVGILARVNHLAIMAAVALAITVAGDVWIFTRRQP